jgi:predicted phosphodiesterase
MRTLILSDVHGNQVALQKVLDHAYRLFRPAEVWCLGDVVGYGPDPLPVWNTLRHEPVPPGGWLAGNHDWGLVNKLQIGRLLHINGFDQGLKLQNFRDKAAKVLLEHQNRLSANQEVMTHFLELPAMSHLRSGIYLSHGSFLADVERAITQYLVTARMHSPELSPDKMVVNLEKAANKRSETVYLAQPPALPKLFAFGHNHRPGLWRWQQGRWTPLDLQERHPLNDLQAAPICLNPGSVGFPRGGSGCPTYAFIDWEGDRQTPPFVAIQQVAYDVSAVRRKMERNPYNLLLDEPGFLVDARC